MQRLSLGLVILLGSASLSVAQPTQTELTQLARTGYGSDPWTLKRLREIGYRRYVEEQLRPRRIDDSAVDAALAGAEFDAWTMTTLELQAAFNNPGPRPAGQLHRQLRAEFFLRATSSRRQLTALLSEFWFNHFNVDLPGKTGRWVVPYLRDAIRPNMFSTFEELLVAVARSPAMLRYLNNNENFKPGFTRRGKVLGINENYARELMELHTFGVDDQAGVYTQEDIIEVARCLTGWTVDAKLEGGFSFWARAHDTGSKSPIGLTIPAGGAEDDGLKVLKALANHPQTAKFICRKLTVFLVGGASQDVYGRAVRTFRQTGGNLRDVVREILLSPELVTLAGNKIKRPTLLLVSAARAVGSRIPAGASGVETLIRLFNRTSEAGLTLYRIPPPTGWSDSKRAFVNGGTMIKRFNVLHASFAGDKRLTTRFDPAASTGTGKSVVEAIRKRVLGKDRPLPDAKRNALIQFYDSRPAGVSAADRARAVMALILSSPEFARY